MVKDRKVKTDNYLYLETHFDNLDSMLDAINEMKKAIFENKETEELMITFDYDMIDKKDYKFIFQAFTKISMN